jgi:hypothetical protein
MRPFIDGVVNAPGLSIEVLPLTDARDRYSRIYPEADIAEIGSSKLIRAASQGLDWVGLPVL